MNIVITCGISILGRFRDNKDDVPNETFKKDFLALPMDKAGAELSAIYKLWNDENIPQNVSHIYFLTTDTRRGHYVAQLLQTYIEQNTDAKAEAVVVKGLTPTSDEIYFKQGLPNLVREISRYVYDRGIARGKSAVVLPIGGFKQTSTFATLTAQILGVPAYFSLSHSAPLMKVPPLPITLDKEWARRKDIYHILMSLDEGINVKTFNQLISSLSEEDRSKLMPFVERIKIDNMVVVSLSSMGTLLLSAIKRFSGVILKPREGKMIFQSSASEEHSKEFINKYQVKERLEQIPFVRVVRVTKYSQKQKQARPKVTEKSNGHFSVALALGSDGILNLDIETTASTPEELSEAKRKLKEYLNELF